MNHRLKRVYIPRIRSYLIILCLITGVVFCYRGFRSFSRIIEETGLTPKTVYRLIFNHGADLKSASGRTNVLIMGMGGGNHEGSDLTDTIIVMSVKPENSTMSLISLPRDIWSETLQDKINSAYHYGEAKVKGGGITLAKVVIEDIIGIPLHYALIMDFSEFKTIIDLAGGIDINIRNGFTDKDYPVEGKENDECGGDPLYRCRYREVTFISGTQHMDGETALIYVRSRHAEGDEGTDFSRSRRQQEVLVALKDELSRPLQIIRLRQNLNIFRALDKATDTDMTVGVLLTLIKTGGKADSRKIRKITLDDMFTSPPEYLYGGRYVLIPKTSNSDIAVFVQNQLEQN